MSNPTPTTQSDAQLPAQQPAHPTAQQAPQPYLPPHGYLSLGQVYSPQLTMPQPAYRGYNFTAGYSGSPGHLYGDPAYHVKNAQYESPMMSMAARRVIDNYPRYGLGGVSGHFDNRYGLGSVLPEKSSGSGHDAAFDHVNRTGRMAQEQLDYFIRRDHLEDMLDDRQTAYRFTPMRTARMPQSTEAGTTAAASRGNSTGQYRFTDSDKQTPSLAERMSRLGRKLPVEIDSPTNDLIPEEKGSNCKGEQSGKAQDGVQTTRPSHHSAPQEFSMHMEETYSDLQRELVATRNLLSTIKEHLALAKVANGAHKEHHGRALHQTYSPAAHGSAAPKADNSSADRIMAGIENFKKEYNKVMAARNRTQQTQGKDEDICKADEIPITVPDKYPRWMETSYVRCPIDSDSSISEFSPINTPVVTPPANKVVPDNKPAHFHGISTGGMKRYASSHAVKPATKPAPVAMSQSDRDNISLQMEKLSRAQAIEPAAEFAPAIRSRSNNDHISMLMKQLADDKADQAAHPKSSTASTAAPASQPTPLAADTPFENIAFAIDMHSFPDIVMAALGDMGCDNLAEFWALPDIKAYREEQFILIEALMLESLGGLRRHYIEGEVEGREKIKKALQWLLEAAGVGGAAPRE